MNTRRFTWVLLPLLLLGCEDETTAPPPPDPLTPEEQIIVANCRTLRDSFEAYAAAHGGSFGQFQIHDMLFFDNPYTGENEPSGALGGRPGAIVVDAYDDCDGNVLGYRITGHGEKGVLITLENRTNVSPSDQTMHDVMIANALLVFDAAKRFADANHGEYPGDLSDTNDDGNTLIDLLPNGEYLINPISSMQDTPVDGTAMEGGAIGYTAIDMVGDGTYNAFYVDGMGCTGTQVLVLTLYSEKEEFVYQDALKLRLAVELFKQASGHYPHNLDTETTPGGKTTLDLYLSTGGELKNHLTNEDYVPVIGIAASKGESAYQPVETDGVVTDFLVTARGFFKEILRVGPIQ
ncbi:MAG TPA: hypothetical protein VF247_09250 [Candidatus Krumholzibacteria bacterium]